MDIRRVEGIYPLAPMQEDILAACLGKCDAERYTGQLTCELEGSLNVQIFEEAWQQAITRHSTLRTSFGWKRLEKPVQIVQRELSVPLEQQDWREMSPEDQQKQIADWQQTNCAWVADPGEAPLMRLTLCRTAEDTFLFIWDYHRLLLDDDSASLILGEVTLLYDRLRQGQLLSLPRGPQYSDYIAWLRQQNLPATKAFWRRHIGEFTEPTSLSLHRVPPNSSAQQAFEEREMKFSETLTARLRNFAQEQQLSLDTIIEAAWSLLLSRYSGQDEVVFGIEASVRPAGLHNAESIAGQFVSELPTRVRVPDNEVVSEWLKEIHAQETEWHQHTHVSQALIRQWSGAPETRPLFQTKLVHANPAAIQSSSVVKGRLNVRNFTISDKTGCPLSLRFQTAPETAIKIIYRADLFAVGTIERMLGHYEVLLEGIVGKAEERISRLPLLSESEREQVLGVWNQRGVEYPAERCLHGLFEEQVERRAEAVAVVYEDQQLSYGELNERANRLGHYLRGRGVGAEVLVGVMVERSLEMVVAILGVLKAGGAYVPLDPSYPRERVRLMLADSGAKVVLTEGRWADGLGESGAEVVCIDKDWEAIGRESAENVESGVGPENLAYVIYTSGSTGRPKGVMVEHRQVGRLLQATAEWFGFNERDVWTLFHSYAFDFSVWELWGALAYGGRLVVVPYLVSRSPEAFVELLEEAGVTVLNQTPSAFGQLLWAEERRGEEREQGPELKVRVVIFGGEALDAGRLAGWVKRHGAERPELINMYGITETTVHVTYHRVRAEEVEGSSRGSLVGVPIPDVRVYVLDRQQGLAPAGVAGELYVGGAGVARGYLQRAGLTGERFVPDAYGSEHGGRLYRTGDVGRWLESGELEYLGRADHQVKVRGHRIELGEIEVVLRGHGGVREAVVLALGEAGGEQRLVAYIEGERAGGGEQTAGSVVADNQVAGGVSGGELREYLGAQLPEYMVPGGYVLLERMPVTENGKVDRRALAELGEEGAERGAVGEYVAPRTPIEEMLAEIWSQVLRVDRVGINDNFFDLGGDSILGIQVIARAVDAGIQLIPRQIFQHQTIAELSAVSGMALPVSLSSLPSDDLTSADLPEMSFDPQELDKILAKVRFGD